MRRQHRLSAQNSRHSNGLMSQNAGEVNANGVWTTTQYAPPAYENIYNSSLPINPPPDYESAKKKNITFNNSNAHSNNISEMPANKSADTLVSYQASQLENSNGQQVVVSNRDVDSFDNPLFSLNITSNASNNATSAGEDSTNKDNDVTVAFKEARNTSGQKFNGTSTQDPNL